MTVEFLDVALFGAYFFLTSVVLTPILFFSCADRRAANRYSSRSELSTQEPPKQSTTSQRSAVENKENGRVKSRRGDSRNSSVQSSDASDANDELGLKSPVCDLSRTDRSQAFGEPAAKAQPKANKPSPMPFETAKRESGTKQSSSNLGLPKRGLRRKSTIRLVPSPLPVETVEQSQGTSSEEVSNRERAVREIGSLARRDMAGKKGKKPESESDEVTASIYLAVSTSMNANPGNDAES